MNVKDIIEAIYRGFKDSIWGIWRTFQLDKEIEEKRLTRLSPSRSATALRRRRGSVQRERPQLRDQHHEQNKILRTVSLTCLLNGGLFISTTLIFNFGLGSMIATLIGWPEDDQQGLFSFMFTVIRLIIQVAWTIPLYAISRVTNSLWFQDIADAAYEHCSGKPASFPDFSRAVSDYLFSVWIAFLFFVQATLVLYIPIKMVANTLYFIHLCALYSMYVFEYKWFNMGWVLDRRLSYIERNWPYFIGFGASLAIFTQLTNSVIINGCIFAILFPFYIISGIEASPHTVDIFPLRLFSPAVGFTSVMFSNLVIKRYGKNRAARVDTTGSNADELSASSRSSASAASNRTHGSLSSSNMSRFSSDVRSTSTRL